MRIRRCLPFLAAAALAGCGPDADALESAAVHALTTEVPALQARYRAEHGRYASHIRDLTGGADTLASGIRVLIHGGGPAGWSATSSHPDVPGAVCGVMVGNPDKAPSLRGGVGPERPGEVRCMSFRAWKERQVIERSGPFAVAP